MRYDFCIIGGGIVGLATALNLRRRRPSSSIIVLEKENAVGLHQTGHNSGVIHSGIYYQPGSLKARLCSEGCAATKEFCVENDVPFEVCGKILVATEAEDEQRLPLLLKRARKNGIAVERLSRLDLREMEPNITGRSALLVRGTGIVDYQKVSCAMQEVIQRSGGEIRLGVTVKSILERGSEVEVVAVDGSVLLATKLIVCAGLQSDRLARCAGLNVDYRIIPFRGEYYRLPLEKSQPVRHLIYPVPDPALPFLGIHLTRMLDGSMTVGPNAVVGFAREGYRKLSFNLRDTSDTLSFPGFWKLTGANWRAGLDELRNSFWRRAYLAACRKYCPTLEMGDLQPHAAGIRAQAVLSDGTLVHDFLFSETARMLHVLNAPSPAATSALPIGRMISDRILAESAPSAR
jgi:L-2-hydroxyglutarate oxidase